MNKTYQELCDEVLELRTQLEAAEQRNESLQRQTAFKVASVNRTDEYVILRLVGQVLGEDMDAIRNSMKRLGVRGLLIANWEVEVLNESDMAKAGWFRREALCPHALQDARGEP